ncbi:MAG: ABC transporter permease [Thermomicrobiales bacterium]|nr:ABC transporter permease [Thermomicrobiales bacterium]
MAVPGSSAPIFIDARWVSPSYIDVASLELRQGSWPVDTADARAIRVVVTQAGLTKLGLSEDTAVGAVVDYFGDTGSQFDMRLRPRFPMVIEGVVSSSGRTQEGVELLIVTSGNVIPGLSAYPSTWLVHAPPADQPMIEHLAQSFLSGTDPAVMFDVRRMDQQGEVKPVLDQQKTTSNILSLIILGVAAIGLVSTGLSSIRERAQEFGIRRAIGVTTKTVFAGVVVQTLIEAAIAALVALVLAAVIVVTFGERLILVDVALTSQPSLPFASAVRGVMSALAVGLLASLLPAFRAARYSVAQVIRA